MANKISVLIDVATDKAVSGLKGFKQSVGDADGAVNKFKAGASGAFDAIKHQAGNMAMVAGAAIVTFGVKSVKAFQDTALAAGKLADATGLSTEEASKWTAVADDIGISSEAMEKSFGKLAQSIGKNNPLLEQYGVTVQKGADGQADMNATMLHAIDVIRSIEDPTKKAAVAQAAFGKGWMEMAELIEQGSGSLKESMAAVSEAQIIDPEEVAKARKMRESMDELQDSVRDVALVVGEDLVPMVAVLADGLTTLIGPLSSVNQWSKDVTLGFLELVGVIDKLPGDTEDAGKGIGQMATQLDEASGSGHMHIEMQEGLKTVVDETADATDVLSRANENLADKIEQTTNRFRELKGELSAEEAFHNAQAMWDELGQSAVDAMTAAEAGTEDASQKMFDHKGKVIDAKQAVVDLGAQYADLPEEEITSIVALIDEGSLAEAERRFNILARNRQMNISITSNGGVGFNNLPGNVQGATGGIVTRPTMALIGEAGPEAVVPLNQTPGSSPLNGFGSNGHAPISITVNAGMGADGKEIGDLIVGKIREYERRNGSGWRG